MMGRWLHRLPTVRSNKDSGARFAQLPPLPQNAPNRTQRVKSPLVAVAIAPHVDSAQTILSEATEVLQ